eukprot:IDg18035t1
MGCFNCDDPDHTINKCSKPINSTRAAKNKIEYYTKKTGNSRNAHIVLYQLCNQLDEAAEALNMSSDGPNTDIQLPEVTDNELFEALVLCLDKGVEENCEDIPFETFFIGTLTSINFTSEVENGFLGACLDIGATKSVVGRKQAEEYYKFLGIPLVIKKSTSNLFKFGEHRVRSIGVSLFRIPYANDRTILEELDVVDINVPLLIGLDLMDKHKIFVDNVDNKLVCKDLQWCHQVKRKLGHLFYEWTYDTMYSETELKRIHRHFYHPKPERLYSLIKRAGDREATPETMKKLENLTESCDVCQRLSEQPGRFRVSLPNEEIVFNRVVLIDLMYLDSKSVLHIICKDTLFSAAIFLSDGESAQNIWDAYMRYWVNPYVGFSKAIHTDQGPQFTSDKWKSLLLYAGIEQKLSGVESHSALGAGERYHEFLRQVYRKVKAEHSRISADDCLSLAVSAMNNTAGKNGLTPTLLLFGVPPQFPL